jgi:hypothetical protein
MKDIASLSLDELDEGIAKEESFSLHDAKRTDYKVSSSFMLTGGCILVW